MFEFEVINKKTKKPITDRQVDNIARKNDLLVYDIDGFALTDCGQIILMDDCGKFCYLDMNKYTVRIKADIKHECF